MILLPVVPMCHISVHFSHSSLLILIASVLNRKSSGNECTTRKMYQMSYCKAVKPPMATFPFLIESCVVICSLCRESPESMTCGKTSHFTLLLFVSIDIYTPWPYAHKKLIPGAPLMQFQQLWIIAGRHDAYWRRSSLKVFS